MFSTPKTEQHGCSGAPQGSGSRIFFGDPSDVGEIKAAVRCFRDGRHRATAGAVFSREEAARWEQIDKPRDLPDGFLRREAMAWSVALVSAEMSALAGMLEADERQLCAAETHCQVEQDAVNRQTSAALEEQIGHDLADGGQALQDALEQMVQGADELFGDSGLSAEEGQGLARSSQDSEALQEIRTMIQAAWREAGRLAAVGTEQWSEATQAQAQDRAAACRHELESVWRDVTTGMTDGRWRAKDDADGVEVLQSGLCATRDIGHGAERVRSLRELVGRTQVLCSHIWADRRVLEQLLRRCRMEVKRELECLRRDLQPGSLGAHEMLSTAPADGGSRSRVIQSSCDQGGAAARPASADRRLWRTWSLQASALYQLGLALVLLGMLLWQGFADLISGAAQVAAAGAAALCIGWWCYRATRMTGIVATCIAVQCRQLWRIRSVVMSTAVMMELCCQILAHQWFRRMLAWVHPRPMLECLRCTACSGLVGHPFSSRCRTKHYCSKRCRRVIGTLLVRRSAAGAVAAVQRAAELADVLRRELRAGARRHRQDRCTVLSDGDAISRWDFTNGDAVLASYLGLAPAEGRTGGEGDQPATSEEGRSMEASRLTGGAQTSPPAVSSEGGLQADGSVGPHAGGPLPAALSDELPIQDRGGALERRGHPPQIGQGFLLALAKVGLAVGVRPALQALRQQGFVTDSRQVRAGRLELRSRQAASAQTDPEGDGRKRDGSAGPKWTRAGPSESLEELARRQGIQSSHCSYTSGAVPASSEVSTTSTSKWVEGQEEAFRLKLLLIYAKGRPRQITLSEEETVAVHRWQQTLEAALQGLGTEIASSFTAKWGSVQEVVDDPVATAELHLTSLLTGWTISEVIYRYMMAVDRPEVVSGELNLQALLLWESDHYRSHPFWSRMEADHYRSASPSTATMHGRFITRLCSALGIEMDEVVPFAATERPAFFFLRMVSVVANDSLTPTISEQDRTGLSHIWRRRLAFAEYCRARHPDAKRLALYLDLAALRAARRVDEFTWVSDWIQQLMSGNFRPVTGLHREGNEGSRVTKEPWDGRRNECSLSSAIFVLRQAMHSCDVKLASGAQSRLDKLLGIEEGEIYAPASPLDLKSLRAEWEQESNKMLTTQSTPLFRQLHDALFRPKNVQGTEYDGIDVVSLLEQLMLPVLDDVVGRGGKFFGAQVRHERYCGCCGERLGEGTDVWQRTLSLPTGQALSAAFTEISEIKREVFIHGPDHKPCRSTIQHSVQTVSAVGQVLVVFETPGQGGWPGRGSAEMLMFLRSEGVALAQVAGVTTALPDDRSLGHSVAFSHDYQAKITSVLDEGVVRQQALYSESPGQRIERLTHLQVNIYAACEVATTGRPWLEERIWGPSREGTVIRLPVAGGLSAFSLDTSWATWGASNRADAVKRRNRPSEDQQSGEEGGNEGSPTKRPAPSSGDDTAPTDPNFLQRFLDDAFPRMHCVQQGEACSLSEAKAEVEEVLQPALEQYFGEGPAVDAQLRPSASAFGRMTASTMAKYGPVLLLSAVAGGQLAIRATQIVVHTAGGRQSLEACWPKVLQDGTGSNAWRMGAPRQVGHESVRHGSRRVGSGPSTLMVRSRPRDLFLYTTEEYGEPEGDGQGLWAEPNTWPVCVGQASEDAGSAELSLDRALRVQLDMLGAAQQVLCGNFDTVVLPPVAADEEQHHCFVTSDVRSADPDMAAFLPDATLTLMSFLTGEARVSGPYVDQLVQLGEDRLRKGIRTCGQVEECDLAWCREVHDVYETQAWTATTSAARKGLGAGSAHSRRRSGTPS